MENFILHKHSFGKKQKTIEQKLLLQNIVYTRVLQIKKTEGT